MGMREALEWYVAAEDRATANDETINLREFSRRARAALEADTPSGTDVFLRALCEQHGLRAAQVSFLGDCSPDHYFSAAVHWGETFGDSHCALGNGPDVETAMRHAVEAMKRKQTA